MGGSSAAEACRNILQCVTYPARTAAAGEPPCWVSPKARRRGQRKPWCPADRFDGCCDWRGDRSRQLHVWRPREQRASSGRNGNRVFAPGDNIPKDRASIGPRGARSAPMTWEGVRGCRGKHPPNLLLPQTAGDGLRRFPIDAPQRLTENELSDFSRLWHDGCVKAIIEAQDVDRNHSAQGMSERDSATQAMSRMRNGR